MGKRRFDCGAELYCGQNARSTRALAGIGVQTRAASVNALHLLASRGKRLALRRL